jgi:nucleoside-diphosphate-sugar epimerase
MKILITGGTGFFGRHLVWRFAEAGAEVIFTGRNAKAAEDVLRHATRPVQWLPLEHGAPSAQVLLQNAAEQADAIIHCASLSTPWGRKEDFYRANVLSTIEVLAACKEAQVKRLIHISTPSLYFNFSDRLQIREDSALPAPVNEYARTKGIAESLVRSSQAAETVILRPRALFGPWDQTLMPRLLRVMQHGTLPVMRGDHIQLDLTYIDNAVQAVWLATTQKLPRPLVTYNVSNGEPQQLMPLLEMMAHEFSLPLRTRKVPWPLMSLLARGMETVAHLGAGKEPLLTRYSAGVLAFSQTLDISALTEELGYQPNVSISEGIRRHAEWWRSYNQGLKG